MPRLAVQIVLFNSSKHLEPLLDSLKAQTDQDFEVFFLDNSEDSIESEYSRTLVRSYDSRSTFHVSRSNIGFDGGHEELYRMHDAPFVLLLNDDATLAPNYIEEVMKRIESDVRIASVVGLVYRTDGETIDTTGIEYKCLARIVDRQIVPASDGEVFGVSGAIALYRRAAIEKAGGLFDPTWFMYKEDVDLALRLRQAGFIAWFEPHAIAWHKRGLQQKRNILERFLSEWQRPARLRRCAYTNQLRIYRRHFCWSLGLKDISQSLATELIRSAGTFLVSPKVFVQSWYDAFTS